MRTIRDVAAPGAGRAIGGDGGSRALIAAGQLKHFAACYGQVDFDGGAAVDAASAALLRIAPGDSFLAVKR